MSRADLEGDQMNLLQRVRWWLQGHWTCIRCGRKLSTMTFGYGECICPDCFRGELRFLFPDASFILNRLTLRLWLNIRRG
jgi:hypothetical protein